MLKMHPPVTDDYVVISYASILRRLMAKLIDYSIFLVAAFILFKSEINIYIVIPALFLEYVYNSIFIYLSGKTLGCFLLRIEIISLSGGRISLKQAVIRSLCTKLSEFCLGLGYFWILLNDYNQTWQDILAGTIVIKSSNSFKIKERFSKAPLADSIRIRRLRYICAILGLVLVVNSSLDKLIERGGKAGLNLLASANLEDILIDALTYDFDGNGDKELLTLNTDNGQKCIYVYNLKSTTLNLIASIPINGSPEDMGTSLQAFRIADLDRDNKAELIISQYSAVEQDMLSEIVIYKRFDESIFKESSRISEKIMKAGSSPPNLEVFQVEDNNFRIAWLAGQRLKILTFGETGFTEVFNTFVYKNSTLLSGKLNSKEESNIYLAEQYSDEILVNRLDFDSNKMKKSLTGSLNDKLSHIYDLSDEHIKCGDIDGDGLDELFLQDKSGGFKKKMLNEKRSLNWLNVYKLSSQEWKKIWMGGNIDASKRYNYKTSYIDTNGRIIIVMSSNNGYFNITDKGKEKSTSSRMYVYTKDTFIFYLIGLKQKINSLFELFNI